VFVIKIWGNENLDVGEECDDGNTDNNDGWDENWQIESGYICTNGPSGSSWYVSWGNNVIDGSETCDDGNRLDNDGCSSVCQIESGYKCTTINNTSVWEFVCGDGYINTGEECDDGNYINGDGWTNSCTKEPGYECRNNTNRSFWEKLWGNGIIDDGEGWDDGNYSPKDGWGEDWTEETGFYWLNVSSWQPNPPWVNETFRSIWYPTWGNGKLDVDAGEVWDDGNGMNNDGWSSSWTVETNYEWEFRPEDAPHTWVSLYFPPIIESSSVDTAKNEIKYIFNDTMINANVTDNHMSLEMTGPNAPYQVDWSGKFTKDNEFTISFSISPSVMGGVGEKLIISIEDVNAFKSTKEMSLASPITLYGEFDKVETDATTSGASKSASYTFLFTAGLSVGVSIFTGGSMELIWGSRNATWLKLIIGYVKEKLGFS
jgi:cysteine-rich repeat protein